VNSDEGNSNMMQIIILFLCCHCRLAAKNDTSFLRCRHIIVCSSIVLPPSLVWSTMWMSLAKLLLSIAQAPHECMDFIAQFTSLLLTVHAFS